MSEVPETSDAAPAHYKWVVLAVIAAGSVLAVMDIGMVGIGTPAMMDALDTDANTIVWVSLAYTLVGAGPVLVLGWVGDTVGRKRVYLWGILILAVGLALSALSQNVSQLIVVRLLGAVGWSMMLAVDNALLTQGFPAHQRGRAQGVNTAALGVGVGIATIVGGVLVDLVGWRALFWSRIPGQLLLAFLAWRFLRDEPMDRRGPLQVDYAGAVILTAAMLTCLLAINQAGWSGVGSPVVIALAVATAFLLPVLLLVEKRTAIPILELKLFASRIFSSGIMAQVIFQMSQGSLSFLMPFYLIQGLGHSAFFAGLMVFPFSFTRLIFSPVAGLVADRVGTRGPSTLGLLMLLGAMLALARLGAGAPAWQILIPIVVGGAGVSIFLPANNSAILGGVPRSYLGSAAAFLAAGRALGNSIGFALAAALFSSTLVAEEAKDAGLAAETVVAAFGDAITVTAIVGFAGLLAIYLRGRR